MGEAGQSGDTGAADSGVGADSRDRTLLNGWATSDSPWSSAGAALDPSSDVPPWHRAAAEFRPPSEFRPADFRPSEVARPAGFRPLEEANREAEAGHAGKNQRDPGSWPVDEIRPSNELESGKAATTPENGSATRWSDSRSRYADLLAHLAPTPNGSEPSHSTDDTARPGDGSSRIPVSAPPYPYEGDLGDGGRREPPAESARHAIEQATPPNGLPHIGPRTDRPGAGQPRPGAGQPPSGQPLHGQPLPGQPFPSQLGPGLPTSGQSGSNSLGFGRNGLVQPEPDEELRPVPESLAPGVADPIQPRPSYDPSSFPRRLPYESRTQGASQRSEYDSTPPADASTGYASPAAYAGFTDRTGGEPATGVIADRSTPALPQRVPAEPDVPTVPEPPSVEPPAETPALARIATHLRRGDVLPPQERQEGFDVTAVLGAVREVAGVRGAALRTTPAGAHSLRLDLADGADPAEVSRRVARLLQDRMGLDAAMQAPEAVFSGDTNPNAGAAKAPAVASVAGTPSTGTGYVPAQLVPPGRAPVSGAGIIGTTTGSTVPGEQLRRLPSAGWGRATVDSAPGRGAVETTTSVATAERLPTGVESAPPRPLIPGDRPGPRVVIENVQINTFGIEATVEVRLSVGEQVASGVATGPAVEGYLLRLCAMATASAIDELLSFADHADGPARCFVEHAASVPFGASEVAVVVMLLSCSGWVEQLAGSSVVTGDNRHAMVRATLAAVNRRLEALLS